MAYEYIDTKQAAEYIGGGTNTRTVVAWMKAGKLRHVRNPSVRGRYKTTTEWIDEALKAGASDTAVPVLVEVPAEFIEELANRNPIRYNGLANGPTPSE